MVSAPVTRVDGVPACRPAGGGVRGAPILSAMRVIGLMSGTSADGVDAALVEWPDSSEARPFRLLAAREDPHDRELQQRIHALAAGELAAGAMLA